jgi:hypothetical protein
MPGRKTGDKAVIEQLRRRTNASVRKLQAKEKKSKEDEQRIERLRAAFEKNDDEIEEAVDEMDLDNDPNDHGSGQPQKKNEEPGKPEGKNEEPGKPEEKKEEPGKPEEKKEEPGRPEEKKEEPGKPEDKKEEPGKEKKEPGKPEDKKEPGKSEEESDTEPLIINSIEDDDDDDEDNEVKPEDPELGTALVGAENPASSEKFETLGWTGSLCINRYGPRNAGVFRMERRCEKDYERLPSDCVSNKSYGYGRAYDDKGNWKYDKDTHVVGIFGVAWKHDKALNRSENVELLNPANPIYETKFDEDGKKIRKVPFPTNYVLLVWKIDGERCKSWEPRTVINRLWGSPSDATRDIYKAARAQEKRRGELDLPATHPDHRKATSKSPSRALDRATTPLRASPGRSTRKASPAKDSAQDVEAVIEDLTARFLKFWGVDSVAELDPPVQKVVKKEFLARTAAVSAS